MCVCAARARVRRANLAAELGLLYGRREVRRLVEAQHQPGIAPPRASSSRAYPNRSSPLDPPRRPPPLPPANTATQGGRLRTAASEIRSRDDSSSNHSIMWQLSIALDWISITPTRTSMHQQL